MRSWITIGILSVFVLASPQAIAEGPQWHRDVSAAWTLAQKNQRPMFVFVTMPGCFYCKKMVAETFGDQGVKQDLANVFVNAVADSQSNASLVRHFKIRSFPTTLVISPTGQLLDRMNGFVAPHQLRQRLRTAYAREIAMR